LGAFILGYDGLKLSSSNQLDSTHAPKVLTTLSTFTVGDVDNLYKKIQTQTKSLDYKILFGYDILDNKYESQISLSLKNIEKSLKEISDCYIFFKKSYNAYKHGYRLWIGKEKGIESAIFRNKNGSEDHIPLDDDSIKLVMNSGKHCLSIFTIIRNNCSVA
jgi:hypothetical protein